MGGATLLPMGKSDGDTPPSGWLEYFQQAAEAAGYLGRGWKARLARDIDVYDSHVSRWASGERTPDIDSCVKLAGALGRPLPEVLVAAGRFTAEQLEVSAEPPELPRRLSPQLERLSLMLDDPEAPEAMKAHIRALIDVALGLVDDVTTSPERRIS